MLPYLFLETDRQKEIKVQSTRALFSEKDFGTACKTVLDTLERPLVMWKRDNIENRKNILYMYFEKSLPYYYGKGFGTAELTLPIKLINTFPDPKNNLVEMPGVEPGSEKTHSKTFS